VTETEKKGNKWYAIEALPATCLRLALESLLPEKPDLVISGINKGSTMGVVTFYSATVACAREAAFARIPAIAVHLERGEAMDYEGAAVFIADLVREIRKKTFKPGLFLNINIPAVPREQIRGVLITKLDPRATLEFYEKKLDPSGKLYFMRSFKLLDPADEKTDIWALAHGYISITPLQFDQTDYSALKSLKSWAGKLWKK
jgi:5'-nucleotidase